MLVKFTKNDGHFICIEAASIQEVRSSGDGVYVDGHLVKNSVDDCLKAVNYAKRESMPFLNKETIAQVHGDPGLAGNLPMMMLVGMTMAGRN